jgi:hypothetical protein
MFVMLNKEKSTDRLMLNVRGILLGEMLWDKLWGGIYPRRFLGICKIDI